MSDAATASRTGGCHCGGVRFTVALPGELRAARCNCSICSMKGVVMVAAPVEALQVTAGEELLRTYRFNTEAARHRFCCIIPQNRRPAQARSPRNRPAIRRGVVRCLLIGVL